MTKGQQGTIKDLFIEELKDIFNAENQIVAALPNMAKAADSPDLKEAFSKHLQETKNQVERLVKIFSHLGIQPSKTKKCEAMEGLIAEGEEAIKEFDKSALRDAALIAKAQRIEHYEIATYGTLVTFAKELDLSEAEKLLKETLAEEGNADKKLTKLAEGGLLTAGINSRANE